MGNCLGINCNFNTPCDHLIGVCFPHEGAPRWKAINDLQDDLERLQAIRDDITRTFRENLSMIPSDQETLWLQQVETLVAKVETLKADYYRLHPRTDSTQEEEAANNSAPIVESSERRPPGQVIQNQQAANNSVPIVESLETRPPVIQNSKCFCCFSPKKCIKSCSLWRKIQLMDLKVLDLVRQKPDLTVERPRIANAQRVPTEPPTGLNLMLNTVWSNVQDESVRSIGLYGMGGVGKTTLLKAINNKLCSSPSHNYGLLLWIVVSKSPNLDDIQNHIGEKIGLRDNAWKLKSQYDKAMDIYNVLCGKKYILLLDDIWEWFDLSTNMGIPIPNNENQSKVIFTTRSLQVCGQMGGTRIQVQCLEGSEAWNLFEEKVGKTTLNAHPDILGLAKDVMRECKGLPLALIVIGRAMTLKTAVQDWEHAIQVLKRYAAEFSNMADKVFTPLKFSYDNLTDQSIRSCFLYCSLYAEDEEILKSDLVDKWICENYLGTYDARNKGYSHISTLVHASLLEECSSERVKMHDVIRDMALWIGGDGFYVQAQAGLTQVPNDVKWKHVEKLSLMNNSIGELNVPTESTELKTILLHRGGLDSINNDFFNRVPYLKVLDLSENPFLSVPKQLCELVSLQYLNLYSTRIEEELPNELRKLVKLKYLNVMHTKVRTIPEGVLLSMKELSVFRCGGGSINYYHADFLGEKLVKELEGLNCLHDVTIPARSEVHISNLTSSVKLQNCITSLHLMGFNERSNSGLDISFLKEIKHLQDLHIDEVNKIKKIEVGKREGLETSMMNNRSGGFNTIRSLEFRHCSGVKNLSWLVFCPNIERIRVTFCHSMKTLLGDENEYRLDNGVEPFAKLQSLYLIGLPNLESICVTSLSFPCLNSLSVGNDVNKLKKLPFNSNSCDGGRGIVIKGENEWWDELQWEDNATRTTFSSCFQFARC